MSAEFIAWLGGSLLVLVFFLSSWAAMYGWLQGPRVRR